MQISFHKMHGLGNDFVIIDTRGFDESPVDSFPPTFIKSLGDRKRGIGFDQLIVMEAPKNPAADVFMRIINNDGSEAEACGNATRCVAKLLMDELGRDGCVVETVAGLLGASRHLDTYTINMGKPRLEWDEIPLAAEADTLGLGFNVGPLMLPCAVNIGNPHAVFFVDNVDEIDLEYWGPQVETHDMFPEKTNVEIAHITDRNTIRMRVWERGVGITDACGSAACATMVAAVRRDLIGREAVVELDGGTLAFKWDAETGDLFMTGPVEYVFKGEVEFG